MKPDGPSRTQRRYGKKCLVCPHCARNVKIRTGHSTSNRSFSFRGKGQERFKQHLKEVHGRG